VCSGETFARADEYPELARPESPGDVQNAELRSEYEALQRDVSRLPIPPRCLHVLCTRAGWSESMSRGRPRTVLDMALWIELSARRMSEASKFLEDLPERIGDAGVVEGEKMPEHKH
jgi:hypothetical protein